MAKAVWTTAGWIMMGWTTITEAPGTLTPSRGLSSLVNDEGEEIGKSRHVEPHDRGPLPRIGLPSCNGQRAHALQGQHEEYQQAHGNERRIHGRTILIRIRLQLLAQEGAVLIHVADAIDRSQRRDDDFTSGDGRNDAGRHLPVKAQRPHDRLDEVAHSTDGRSLDLPGSNAVINTLHGIGIPRFDVRHGLGFCHAVGHPFLDRLRHRCFHGSAPLQEFRARLGTWERGQHPQDDGHPENDLAGSDDKGFRAVHHPP